MPTVLYPNNIFMNVRCHTILNLLSHDKGPYMVFGLVIRFIGFLKIVTITSYSATANSHTESSQSAVSSPVVW
jgi:hypothetical protein